jgi:hypothetical protein
VFGCIAIVSAINFGISFPTAGEFMEHLFQ